MKTFKGIILFVIVALGTSAFTAHEGSRFRYQAKVSTVNDMLQVLGQPGDSQISMPLRDVLVTDRELRFTFYGQPVTITWVGQPDVALKINDIPIPHQDLRSAKLIRQHLLKHSAQKSPAQQRPTEVGLWLLEQLIPPAEAEIVSTGYTFEEVMGRLNVTNFNKFIGALSQLAMAFSQWQMNPSNPYGFHRSQMPSPIQIPKVPTSM